MDTQGRELAGELRVPRNMAQTLAGSIHDDATASKLGFRGGTVAGSIHMDQFVPLLADLHGEAWLGAGTLSLYFKHATVDQEPVRASASLAPGARQARLSMIKHTGEQVCEGTAALGADPDSELARRIEDQAKASDLRILARAAVGPLGEPASVRLSGETLARRLETITETLPAYRGEGAWKGCVLPPSCVVHLAMDVQRGRMPLEGKAVGLFGAIEVQALGQPLLADVDYRSRASILALSESPKTENVWWECVLADPATGRDVARMVQYLRFMKASSPLYA
jgi:hypothetical protein